MRQRLDLTHQQSPEDENSTTNDEESAGPEAITEHATRQVADPETDPVDHRRDRDGPTVPLELFRNRFEHHPEGVDDTEHNQTEKQSGNDNHPAIEELRLRLRHQSSLIHAQWHEN